MITEPDAPQFEELSRELRDCNSCGNSPVWCVWWQTDEDRAEGNDLCHYCQACYKLYVLTKEIE